VRVRALLQFDEDGRREACMSSPHTFPIHLPRHSFTPREVARASDIWRVCQDVALEGSTRGGWPPSRYLEENNAYVMRKMTVAHLREVSPMSTLFAKTWVSKNRRDTINIREIRLYDAETMRDPVSIATQEWAHIDRAKGLSRAPKSLVDAFAVMDIDPSVTLPEPTKIEAGTEHLFSFKCWHIWRDALGHLNHPSYVDAFDEGIYSVAHGKKLETAGIRAHGEQITYRSSINAGDDVQVLTKRVGTIDDVTCVFEQQMRVGETLCAEATLVRSYPEAGALSHAFIP
jgi:acyl-CoA thioesterase FadM